jgi:hypothetical protein
MIIHQTIRMAKPVISGVALVKDFEKSLSILVIPKDPIPVISPTGDMINSTGKRYT